MQIPHLERNEYYLAIKDNQIVQIHSSDVLDGKSE